MEDAVETRVTAPRDSVRIIIACVLAVLSFGCGTYRVTGPVPLTDFTPSGPDARICVLRSADWRLGDTVYQGSGFAVAGRVVQTLRRHFAHVTLLDANEVDAITRCKARQGRYLVVPRILGWEKPAMNSASVLYHVKVQLFLHDTMDQAFTRGVVFEGKQGYPVHFISFLATDLLMDRFDESVLLLLGVRGASAPAPH